MPWQHGNLTAQAAAPAAGGVLAGYTTSLSGQGPVARVLYTTPGHHVHELFTFG
jgi:acetoin utilization deacetylase AcuC-like enzyme